MDHLDFHVATLHPMIRPSRRPGSESCLVHGLIGYWNQGSLVTFTFLIFQSLRTICAAKAPTVSISASHGDAVRLETND